VVGPGGEGRADRRAAEWDSIQRSAADLGRNADGFTMYRITLHDSPNFHVACRGRMDLRRGACI